MITNGNSAQTHSTKRELTLFTYLMVIYSSSITCSIGSVDGDLDKVYRCTAHAAERPLVYSSHSCLSSRLHRLNILQLKFQEIHG